jgi:hypothetical protein
VAEPEAPAASDESPQNVARKRWVEPQPDDRAPKRMRHSADARLDETQDPSPEAIESAEENALAGEQDPIAAGPVTTTTTGTTAAGAAPGSTSTTTAASSMAYSSVSGPVRALAHEFVALQTQLRTGVQPSPGWALGIRLDVLRLCRTFEGVSQFFRGLELLLQSRVTGLTTSSLLESTMQALEELLAPSAPDSREEELVDWVVQALDEPHHTRAFLRQLLGMSCSPAPQCTALFARAREQIDMEDHVESMTLEELIPLLRDYRIVKKELQYTRPPRKPTTQLEVNELHTARFEVTRTAAGFERTVIAEDDAQMNTTEVIAPQMSTFVVDHPQEYSRSLERVFPVRSPSNPSQVHELYADPTNKTGATCEPGPTAGTGVKLIDKSVQIPKGQLETLFGILRRQFPDSPYARDRAGFAHALEQSVERELKATINGDDPPSTRAAEVRRIKPGECAAGEQALAGQWGVFMLNLEPAQQPHIGNGQVLCFFAGAKVIQPMGARRGAEWQGEAEYEQALGDNAGRYSEEYGSVVDSRGGGQVDRIHWKPVGGGNMAQYINTAVMPGSGRHAGKLVSDPEGCHAMLARVNFRMRDRHGQEQRESMNMVVLTKPVPPGGQIRLYYGPDYELQGQPTAARTQVTTPGDGSDSDAQMKWSTAQRSAGATTSTTSGTATATTVATTTPQSIPEGAATSGGTAVARGTPPPAANASLLNLIRSNSTTELAMLLHRRRRSDLDLNATNAAGANMALMAAIVPVANLPIVEMLLRAGATDVGGHVRAAAVDSMNMALLELLARYG